MSHSPPPSPSCERKGWLGWGVGRERKRKRKMKETHGWFAEPLGGWGGKGVGSMKKNDEM